jgi:hypothetical protein
MLIALTGLYLLFHHGMTMAKISLSLIQVRDYSNVQLGLGNLEECLISIIGIFLYMEGGFFDRILVEFCRIAATPRLRLRFDTPNFLIATDLDYN